MIRLFVICSLMLGLTLGWITAPEFAGWQRTSRFRAYFDGLYFSSLSNLISYIKAQGYPLSFLELAYEDYADHLDLQHSYLSQINYLGVYHGRIRSLPENLQKLNSLIKLRLQDQQISRLPESLGSLSNIEILILDGNRLTQLPESLGSLSKLTRLYLSHNYLTRLPTTMDQLTGLQILDLRGNPLPDTEKARLSKLLPGTRIFF